MNPQKIFFSGNIRFLRERKKLSQEAMAALINITRSKLNALESGQTKAPQPEDLLGFSDHFGISVDSLLKTDLSRLSGTGLRELLEGNDPYTTGTHLRVLAITVDQENRENAEYVPVKAKAGYRAGLHDPEYIASLPRFSLPNLPKGSTFRMFPTTGDSMLPIPEGADIICSFVRNWAELKKQTLCIVILKGEQDFVFKQVSLQEDGLLLESLNKNYQPYTVPVSEVLELWKYYSYQTREIPEPQSDLQEMARAIRAMQEELRNMKS